MPDTLRGFVDRLTPGAWRQRKRRAKAKKLGLCQSCCIRKAIRGIVTCKVCKERIANWHLFKFYNVKPEEVFRKLIQQKNRCAICNEKFLKTPHVDHNHKTKKFRGLLCSKCNQAIGLFRENIRFLLQAIRYIKGEKKYDN